MFTSPHALIKTANPIFHYQVRRIGRLSKLKNLRNFSRLMVVGAVIGPILWWGLLIYSDYRATISAPRNSFYAGSSLSEGVSISTIVLFLVGVLLAFIADVWYARTSSACINSQVRAGQWDLVRLTPMRDERILTGIYAVAQVQAWRMLMIEVAVRIAPLVLLIVQFFLPARWLIPTLAGEKLSYWQNSPIYSLSTVPGTSILAMVVAIFAAIVYVAEPFWRMRAVVALGMAVSSRVQHEGSAAGVAIVALLGIRLGQGILLAGLTFIISVITVALLVNIPAPQVYPVSSALSAVQSLAFAVTYSGTFYGLYRFVKARAYRYALSRAFRAD